jgi:hypothetical protein
MMMSPLSASHYLDHEQMFDIVIIDDASYMPTHKAIDIITRGKSVMISGDAKQMPAFVVNDDSITDTESIMDACLAASVPRYGLDWNYGRENLVEFRNAEFYDMRMRTFPPAIQEPMRIRTVHVNNGRYDRALNSNAREAEAVVKEAIEILKDDRKRTGIVTFSESQKDLIHDVLIKEIAKHPSLEAVMSSSAEKIFVRTVNELRCRESDTLLISLAVGKDAEGRVVGMQPFDKDNIEKRLNTALTHASDEIIIFSSVRPADLPDGRKGVDSLKRLLAYTETGTTEKRTRNDELRDRVAKAISDKGYKVCTDIGHSAGMMDIGVADPEHEGRFILGIVMDGGPFIRPFAPDTEFIFRTMLEKNGWSLYRLRTHDWLNSREKATDGIIRTIEARIADKDRWSQKKKKEGAADTDDVFTDMQKRKRALERCRVTYTKANIMEKTVSLEALFSNSSRNMIERDILKVVEAESPVSDRVVAERLCDAYGMQSKYDKLHGHLIKIIEKMELNSALTPWNTKILWKDDYGMRSYAIYRTPAPGDTRKIRDIAVKELINAIIEMIIERPEINLKGLVDNISLIFGHKNADDDAYDIIMQCLNIATKEKLITKDSKGAFIIEE